MLVARVNTNSITIEAAEGFLMTKLRGKKFGLVVGMARGRGSSVGRARDSW